MIATPKDIVFGKHSEGSQQTQEERAQIEAWLADPKNYKRMMERKAERLREAMGLIETKGNWKSQQRAALAKATRASAMNAEKARKSCERRDRLSAAYRADPTPETVNRLSQEEGVSTDRIKDILRSTGISFLRPKKYNVANKVKAPRDEAEAALDGRIARYYRAGWSIDACREKFGVGTKRVNRALDRECVERRTCAERTDKYGVAAE